MNYDDLLSKCQGFLSPEDYARLHEIIIREKERSERIKELNELALEEMAAINQKLGLYDDW